MLPAQTAIGVMSICAVVWEVVIQAPSSKPAWTAPRMSPSPNVESLPVSVDMKVPSSTAEIPNQGIGGFCATATAAGGAPTGAVMDAALTAHPTMGSGD